MAWLTTPLKFAMALIGIFWMAILAGWAVYWWATSAPLGWPNYRLGGKVIGITLHLPDPPGALLRADQAAAKKSRELAAHVAVAQHVASVAIGLEDEHAQEHIRVVYRTIHDEIKLHVTPAVDRAFGLPVSLVRMHDAGVWGVSPAALPLPAGQFDDSRSAVAASELASTIDANYGQCRADQKRLTDLQAWIMAMQATIPGE